MDLDGLIAQFRREADDKTSPYLWTDDDVIAWLDEAEQEAAIRARLLPERVDPTICQVAVAENTPSYNLHPAVLDISHARFVTAGGDKVRLQVVSPDGMDTIWACWRDATVDRPRYLIQDEQTATLVPTPSESGTLHLEVHRLPLDSIEIRSAPEIGLAHHRHLVNWVLFKAFSKPDAETIDPARAAKAEAEFIRYFGLRRDAQLGRDMSADQPHHNIAIW